MNKKEIVIRCLKTFVQAFLATIISFGFIDFNDKAVLKSLIVAGIASGIAALMNVNYKSLEGIEKTKEDENLNDEEIYQIEIDDLDFGGDSDA